MRAFEKTSGPTEERTFDLLWKGMYHRGKSGNQPGTPRGRATMVLPGLMPENVSDKLGTCCQGARSALLPR